MQPRLTFQPRMLTQMFSPRIPFLSIPAPTASPLSRTCDRRNNVENDRFMAIKNSSKQ